ncbi:MAG: LacI family DNA-binding transcriptional regulator [Alkalispirochaeta sp.]
MKDVARIAGVSVSTVSRVINRNVPVNDKTRILVNDAIDQVNYRRNLLASGLRSKSGSLIGLAVPEIGNESFDMFIKYTEEYVRAHSYGLIIGGIHNDPDDEAEFIDHLIRRAVDGIIFIRVSDDSHALEMLNATTIPYVVLDRGGSSAIAPAVVMDNYHSGRLAAQHLMQLGHREFACVTGGLNVPLSRERLSGFSDTLKAAGCSLRDGNIFEGDFEFENGVELASSLLNAKHRATAVWAQNDSMAIGIMAGVVDRGLRVPTDLSIMGVDDIGACRMVRPELTTVRQPFQSMSEAAVKLLFRERELGKRISEHIVVPAELVIRQSTAPPLSQSVSSASQIVKEIS